MTYRIKPRILACNDWTTFSMESPFIPLIHPIVLLTVMMSDPCFRGCPLVFITSVQLACCFLSLPPLDAWCTSIYPLTLGLHNSYSRIGFSDLSSQSYTYLSLFSPNTGFIPLSQWLLHVPLTTCVYSIQLLYCLPSRGPHCSLVLLYVYSVWGPVI